MAKQVKLTAEQGQKFYREYVVAKAKRFDADEPLDYTTWKNYIEEFLAGETAGHNLNWSNTEIRSANRVVVRSGETLSRKQNKAFLNNIMKEENAEARADFLTYYGMDPSTTGETAIKRFLHEHEGAARRFMVGYAADWNQYFNS